MPLFLGAIVTLGLAATNACKTDLPVDNIIDNPGIQGPVGVIEGTVSYYGPPPCFKDGQVEGAMIILLFPFNNPPPPDGLATTASNFQTVAGERLFASTPHPAGSQPGAKGEFCAPLDSPTVTASASFTISEIPAGQYQVRAFYSQRNTFFPLYDIKELPVAGDIAGGAVIDPSAKKPVFIPINIGVQKDPNDPSSPFIMPDQGFIARDVPVVVGVPLLENRPYFYVDYGPLSRSFNNPKVPVQGEKGVPYPTDDVADSSQVGLTFPQDHAITAQQNVACAANPDPACDIFQFAQASLPSVHFFYGFPGKKDDPASPADAWLALNAKPSHAFSGSPLPYYGIDPTVGPSPLSTGFILTRNFTPDGKPAILVDNQNLETLAQVADLFPQVVLAKLQDDDYGNPTQPLTPQANPIVVIQGFTVRKNSMKATAEGGVTGGGLSTIADPSQSNPLHTETGFEQYNDFSAEIRPAALCIRPQPNDLRGVLVAPYELDPNPADLGIQLVNAARIVEVQAARVRGVEFGCIPPGWYTINIVYPSGQAWTTPNTMGTCSFDLQGHPEETCSTPSASLPAQVVSAGFDTRPLLASQEAFKTDAAGNIVKDASGTPIPMIVHVLPSARCMQQKKDSTGQTIFVSNPTHEDTNHDGVLDPGEDVNGNGILDFAIPPICRVLKPAGGSCVDNIQCASGTCTGNVCVTKPKGAACQQAAECTSGTCTANVCG